MRDLLQKYPTRASWTAVEECSYTDIDQQAACLTGYDQRYQQISAGRYHGWFRTVLLGPHIGLYFETFNQSLDQWGACPGGHYAFIFLMAGSEPCLLKSQPFNPDSIMFLPPGAGFDFSAEPGTRYCVINVTSGLLELFLRACLPEEDCSTDPAASARIIRGKHNVQTLRQMMRQGLQLADGFTGTAASKGALAGFQASLVSLLASYVAAASQTQHGLGEAQPHPGVKSAFAARDYLRGEGAAGVTVTDLVQHLGVSRRKLEYAFRSQFDKSPAEYIRLIQLNEFRSALLDEENRTLSIGDIAARNGIWHLSRMARYYRAQFGELPSETRRAAHGPPPAR